jgi:ABC-2 type transport system permease protein
MVYRFELRREITAALIWAEVISAVLLLLLYGFYPIFLDSRAAMEGYIAALPPEMVSAFGLNLDDLFSFEGFFGMVYLYESILGGIMISSVTLAVFAREKQNKCSDFLLTKPKTRSKIFLEKLLCCLTLIGIVNIPYAALYLLSYFDDTGALRLPSSAVLNVLCLPLTQLVFLSFGMFLAVFLRKIRSAAGLGAEIAIFAFLISAVHSLTGKEIFQFFSPLFYFSPHAVAETGGYDISGVATAAVLTLGLSAAAYWKYTKSDLVA